MPFTLLLLESHQPVSARSFVYKACKMDMDSNTWRQTPGVTELINLESLFSRWRILQEVDNTRKMVIIDEELISLMWLLPHEKLATAVPFTSRSTLYSLHLPHGQKMRRTWLKSHLPERAYLQREWVPLVQTSCIATFLSASLLLTCMYTSLPWKIKKTSRDQFLACNSLMQCND